MPLSNPLSSPLLLPVAGTVSTILGVGLISILCAGGWSWGRVASGVLFRRWLTWAAIATISTFGILAGPPGVCLIAIGLAAQGSRELARLFQLRTAERNILISGSIALPLATLIGGSAALFPSLLIAGLLATVSPLLDQDVRHGPRRAAGTMLGLVYLPISLSLLVLIASHRHGGTGLVLAVLLAVALSDVGAFVVGRAIGGRRLASVLSPNKTIAGVGGSLIGAYLGLLVLAWLIPVQAPILVLGPVIGAGAVWGDLFESMLKRSAGAKDSGDWLPGFGGLLDRIDSLLIVLPLVFIVLEAHR